MYGVELVDYTSKVNILIRVKISFPKRAERYATLFVPRSHAKPAMKTTLNNWAYFYHWFCQCCLRANDGGRVPEKT